MNKKIRILALVFLILTLNVISPNTFASTNSKRVRVSFSSISKRYDFFDLSFASSHGIKVNQESEVYAYIIDNPKKYKVVSKKTKFEIHNEIKENFDEFTIDQKNGAVYLVNEKGLRLLNPYTEKDGKFVKKWKNSEIIELDFVGFYENDKLVFAIQGDFVYIESLNKEPFDAVSKKWRGGLSVHKDKDAKLIPINDIDIEDYIKGVVAIEMPHSWHEEALKTQAICSRTYALSTLGTYKKHGFDFDSSTRFQAYGGYLSEKESTNRAVEETKGIVIKHNGKPVSAFFSADNGGYTSNSSDVFFANLPYFKAKEDPYTLHSTKKWTYKINDEIFQSIVQESEKYKNIGKLKDISLLSKNSSNKISEILIKAENGEIKLKKAEIRKFFGYGNIKSLNANLFKSGDSIKESIKKTAEDNEIKNKEKKEEKFSVISSSGVYQKSKNSTKILTFTAGEKSVISLSKNIGILTKLAKKVLFFDNKVAKGSKVNINQPKFEQSLKNGEFMFKGTGYGHGLGLSQVGAKVMANQGNNYEKILNFYFTDVEFW